jgi:putative N6-adenine-specific DNA methylase
LSRPQDYYATCPFGLSGVLAEELRTLGAGDVRAEDAGVAFTGEPPVCWRINLESRIATRILWQVARFAYTSEDSLYHQAKAVVWPRYFAVQRTFKVEVQARRCPLKSLNFVALRIKDAVADHFRAAIGSRPSVAIRDPDVEIHAFLDATHCTLYLDTSGAPLFKRGQREFVGAAPLKKNLAAGILHLAGWRPGTPLLDPMCGSGTFLVEAAEMTLERAAGSGRAFAFERLSGFDADAWHTLRARTTARARSADAALPIFGADLHGRNLDDARRNLEAAGLAQAVQLKQANLLDLSAPAPAGMLITNPPYGERLGDKERLAEFYPQLGNLLKQRFAGWTAHLFSGDAELPKRIRLSTSRKPVLYNGKIECRLYEYRLVAGSNRTSKAGGSP